MAKKKAAPEATAETKAPETTAAAPEAGKEKKKQVYLNRIPEGMVHERTAKESGKKFYSVGVNMIHEGQAIVGNVMVPKSFVQESTRFQGNQKVPNPGFKDVRLGDPDYKMSVTVGPQDPTTGQYPHVEMTAAEVQAAHAEAQKQYNAQKAAKAKGERETPATPAAQAEAPEAEAQSDGLGE